MRKSSSLAAVQLQSHCLRYHHPLAVSHMSHRSGFAQTLLRGSKQALEPESVGPTGRTPEMAKVEALLFLAREPLTSRKIAKLANLEDGTRARSLVRRLSKCYDLAASAFRVEEIAGGFQLLTRRKFSGWIRRLEHIPAEMRLSGPALETLGVVAYRQPVLRAEIESIRGVQCGEILRQLMDRELVKIVGRAEELGRPFQYGTTRRFLQLFGLKHLEDLPRAEEFRNSQNPGTEAVANERSESNDIRIKESHGKEEESNVTVADLVQDDELLQKLQGLQVVAAYDDEDDDYDDDFEDDDDEDLEDDDLDEDDDYEYEDDDEDEDDDYDDELEGDWEEVDDDEEEEVDEDEDEYEDDEDEYEDDDEEEDEEYEEDEDEDYDDDEEDEDWEEEEEDED